MPHLMLLPAAGIVLLVIAVFYRATYLQERKAGRPHEAALNESKMVGTFLLGSAAIDYAAVVANFI